VEKDAIEYINESKRVAHYDAVLRDSQRMLTDLSSQTSRLMVHQTELERILKGIGAHQTELESNLTTLETQVAQVFEAQVHMTPGDADVQRENAYSLALACEQRLQGHFGFYGIHCPEDGGRTRTCLAGGDGRCVPCLEYASDATLSAGTGQPSNGGRYFHPGPCTLEKIVSLQGAVISGENL